jgi:c-di-GMP-binding flagellar brake protein YcgR
MMERRTARRFDLSLPLNFRVPTACAVETQKGKTRDISARGLYFVIDEGLETGLNLDITLTLPVEVTQGAEVFVRIVGKVVRVERRAEDGDSRLGVAAIIERYDVVRGEDVRI